MPDDSPSASLNEAFKYLGLELWRWGRPANWRLDFQRVYSNVQPMAHSEKKVVVLGAGFGGLTFCQSFSHPCAKIILMDRQNHHLFQPLLYQVAAAGLSAPEIAAPIRSILSRRQDVTILMDEVLEIDLDNRVVKARNNVLDYEYLILALGGQTSYFGHPEWKIYAPGLKSLDDALNIRRKILLSFEKAEIESEPEKQKSLMTLIVVGGGPTGVELAGAFAELARHVLKKDFRRIHPNQTRVILVEAGSRLLPHMPPDLSESAKMQLERFSVEVLLNSKVKDIRQGELELADGTIFQSQNIIWAAGVSGNAISEQLKVEKDRGGRIKTLPDLSLPDYPSVFVIGDLASVQDAEGKPIPGVSPAAMQMAKHASNLILNEISSSVPGPKMRTPFHYRDKGVMATIGRSAAVAQIGSLHFRGFPAWMMWLFVHLIFLIGFENRILVLFRWAYAYFTYKRGSRIITGHMDDSEPRS